MSVIENQHSISSDKEMMLPVGQNSRQINKEELKEIVLASQNNQEKGYYIFDNWVNLHQQVFGLPKKLPQTVLNLWRVLKLINFGDDFIPTGLIYDTLVTLMLMAVDCKDQDDKRQTINKVEGILRSIFFQFIQFNGKYLSEQQKQQLAFFRVIRPVAEGYRKIIYQNFQDSQANKTQQKQMTRNEQLFKMHNIFTYKKNLQKLKKIQQQFKQCTFQPDLSYTSRAKIITDSRYLQPSRTQKISQIKNSHLIQDPQFIIPEQQYEDQKLFRANPVPLYPTVSPLGVNEHLERMQKSRQIRKINALRIYHTGSSKKQVKQFSIQQRDKQRKQKMLNSYRILFIIKVEVAKRIYSIKVRQNMGVSDVVRAIEMMVGFKHPDIQEIVKGYFINWQMKINRKAQSPQIQQFSYNENYS